MKLSILESQIHDTDPHDWKKMFWFVAGMFGMMLIFIAAMVWIYWEYFKQ